MTKPLLVGAGLVALAAILVFASLRRVEGEYFESSGVRLHYTDEGQGEPVVLLHGATLNVDLQWRLPGMIDALSSDYRVIALDQRGHGLSAKPADPASYGRPMVGDVIALLDHLAIDRAHLVGYSLGAAVTRRTAISHPERVITALPCAIGWIQPGAFPLSNAGEIADALARDDFEPLLRGLDNTDGPPMPSFVAGVIAWGLASFNDGPALANVLRATDDFSISEAELRRNRVPTLTLMGALDPLREDLDRLDRITPGHETRLIEGFGHDLYPRWSGFEESVKRFLDSHRSAPV